MSQKDKTIFACSKCGAQFPKWFGQCPECGTWGTVAEQSSANLKFRNEKLKTAPLAKVIDFDKVKSQNFSRIKTGIDEIDRVLGGGIVPGSLVLLGGAPGCGKSTLVLQVASQIIKLQVTSYKLQVLYVSGEESAEQIKLRLDRIGISGKNLQFLGETDIETICATIEKQRPILAIIDSIQTMHLDGLDSEAGSVNQVRSSTLKLLEVAKGINTTIFITGHVTKEGTVAGPKTLEHLVDTVLYLEGDPYHHFRLLRSVKNRFGTTNEVGVFDMQKEGLVEVKNPSEAFLVNRDPKISGSVVAPVIEGTRSFLVEIQALVARTAFGYPQRRCAGFDFNRLGHLIAVLSKRCGLGLGNQDVHINVVGGLKIFEPAADLACALAIASAFKNKPIEAEAAVFGEVGLGGEVRSVSWPAKRIKEAENLGFEKIIMPAGKIPTLNSKIKITQVKNLNEAIRFCNL